MTVQLQAADFRLVEEDVIRLEGAGEPLRISRLSTALHHLGLEVHELEVELVVLVVGAEDLSACGVSHHHDSCRTDREAEEETGEPYVEAEED